MLIRSCVALCAWTVLSSANLHRATSVLPDARDLVLKVGEESLSINVDAEDLVIEKYANGTFKSLRTVGGDKIYIIHFFEQEAMAPEKVSLIQRFRLFDSRYLLDGDQEQFDESGERLSVSHFNQGILDGAQKIWSKDGVLLEEKYYDLGCPVKLWKSYYASGQVATAIQFCEAAIDFEKTSLQAPSDSDSSKISQMAYPHPLTVKKVWYGLDGSLAKELSYKLAKVGKDFVLTPTGPL